MIERSTSEESTGGISVIVSTIGRPAVLRRLMHSLESCPDHDRLELVVVDQSEDQGCAAVVEERAWPFTTKVSSSERGVSAGRNRGLAFATHDVIAFPDDDAWYPPETPQRVLETFEDPSLAVLCARQVTADGRNSMLRWKATAGPVTVWNFMRTSISSGLFFRREWLDRVGHFDPTMGVGAASWYGACEESDLLLRVIEAGGDVRYDPSLVVHSDEPRDDLSDAFIDKMLRYGCGQGHLWRKRRLPRSLLAWYLARKGVASVVRAARGQHIAARADLAYIRGNVAGWRDVAPHSLRKVG